MASESENYIRHALLKSGKVVGRKPRNAADIERIGLTTVKVEDIEVVKHAVWHFDEDVREATSAYEVRIRSARTRRDNAMAKGSDGALPTYLSLPISKAAPMPGATS